MDTIPRSPDTSDYALDGTTESRQYSLLDKNESAVCHYDSYGRCFRLEAPIVPLTGSFLEGFMKDEKIS